MDEWAGAVKPDLPSPDCIWPRAKGGGQFTGDLCLLQYGQVDLVIGTGASSDWDGQEASSGQVGRQSLDQEGDAGQSTQAELSSLSQSQSLVSKDPDQVAMPGQRHRRQDDPHAHTAAQDGPRRHGVRHAFTGVQLPLGHASIDQIVPDRGYTVKNARLLYWPINALKRQCRTDVAIKAAVEQISPAAVQRAEDLHARGVKVPRT